MGQKDLTQKNLEYYPDVFSDIINALLYDGQQVVLPQTLQAAPTETLYRGKDKCLHNQFHDVSQYVTQSNKIKIQYILENESRANSKMILRKVGYEGAVYRGQYDRKLQDVYPVVSLVLYWGKRKWKSSKSLRDLFEKQNIPNTAINCLDNIQLRVYDMRFLSKEIRERFTSDMRIVIDYLAAGHKYQPTNQPIRHIEAFLLMLKALSGDSRYEELIGELENKPGEKGVITMCELLDKYEAKGEALLASLMECLFKDNRISDAELVLTNTEFRRKLYLEYGLRKS